MRNLSTNLSPSRIGLKTKIIVALIILLSASLSFAGYEVSNFYNDSYSVDPTCTGEYLPGYWMLHKYRAEMRSWGWSTSTWWPVQHAMLIDPDMVNGGQDYEYVDDADISFMTGHGWVNSSNNYVLNLQTEEDNVLHSCGLVPKVHQRLGEQGMDLEWLHVVSCHSMQTDSNAHKSWRPVFTGVHQITGYHGYAWFSGINSPLGAAYEDFAHDSHNAAIALQWVYELYFHDHFEYPPQSGNYHDQCPVAYTGRDSSSSCNTILNNERYPKPGQMNIGYQDEYTPTTWRRKYIDGCNPAGGSTQ